MERSPLLLLAFCASGALAAEPAVAPALPERMPAPMATRPEEPVQAPTPTPRPLRKAREDQTPNAARPAPAASLPAAESACRRRLSRLGVKFELREPVHDETAGEAELGCRLDHPIVVSAIGNIRLTPEAVLRCPLAEALARFAIGHVAPAARTAFGAELAEIRQVSAFVCRSRSDGTKLSEHATGNAIDIGAFSLTDGRTIPVSPSSDPAVRLFLGSVHEAACGPFKTVLGPGNDADHATHFHFDLAERRNGGTWCPPVAAPADRTKE
jgi:hypothetical protein